MGVANPSLSRARNSRIPREAREAARRAAEEAAAKAGPASIALAQKAAWVLLTASMMGGLAALFGALVGHSLR